MCRWHARTCCLNRVILFFYFPWKYGDFGPVFTHQKNNFLKFVLGFFGHQMEEIHQEKKRWVGFDIDIHEHLQTILKGEKDDCGCNIVCYDTR